jgi:hypothetical protein
MPDEVSTTLTVTAVAGVGKGVGALDELVYEKLLKSKLPMKQLPSASIWANESPVGHALSAAAGRAERPNALTARIKVANL